MSIIIRLQNLPLLARSEDIRDFFGDLYIPDGGVFITGGELGDAFISFTTDDDARTAMRKNGYKIMDVPVKLYLGSHSEMQQEIAKITQQNQDVNRQRSPEEQSSSLCADDYSDNYYRSESPSRWRNDYSHYSRSRSPRRDSKSSEMLSASRRSRSPINQGSGMLSDHHLARSLVTGEKNLSSESPLKVNIKSEYDNMSDKEIQAQFKENYASSSPVAKPQSCGSFSSVNALPSTAMPERSNENLIVTLSGLDPEWGLSKLQNILRGIFIPDRNIKFDLYPSGSKTGTVYIKLCNTVDFWDLLSHKTYFYKYKLITVSVCPDHIFNKHFTCETPSQGSLKSDRGIYYYEVKGLPIDVIYQDVLDFFDDLDVIDVYIAFKKDFKGQRIFDKDKGVIAFVAFSNKSDYQKALSKNVQRFGGTNRKIDLRSITQNEVFELKKGNNDLLLQSKSFVPVPDGGPVPGSVEQAFCTILTGLPETITTKKIFSFFIRSGARAGKIHLSLDDKQHCDGQAFVEFKNLNVLKKACKCDGKRIGKLVISVKEISHEEMLKALDSQKSKQSKLLKTEPLHSYQTPDTCLDETEKNPALRFSHDESFRNTAVISNTTIKVENVFDSDEVEPQGISFNSFPERPLEVHSKTSISYIRDSNAKDALKPEAQSSKRDFRKGCNTFPSESYTFYNEKTGLNESCPISLDMKYAGAMESNNYAGERNHTEGRQWSAPNMRCGSSSTISYSNSEPYGYGGMPCDYEKAVVQIKNIDPFLTIPDLITFLRGFNIGANNIIRMFNDRGYPTADVRVTFRNHKDAERAIKNLNGRLVNGVPVEVSAVPQIQP